MSQLQRVLAAVLVFVGICVFLTMCLYVCVLNYLLVHAYELMLLFTLELRNLFNKGPEKETDLICNKQQIYVILFTEISKITANKQNI